MRDLIGQMVMVGFHGKSAVELERMIVEEGVGGVILFSRNIESFQQVRDLVAGLQELAAGRDPGLPLLIGIDQEGGRVFRLPPPFRQYPSYRELAKKGSAEFIRMNSDSLADELVSVGINMNMAPVLDVDTNPDNPVIGDRSFGTEPELVGKYGAVVMNSFIEKGIIPVGKHFPGHGDTSVDSHLDLPVVRKPVSELEKVEWKPYRETIGKGLPVIMTAHILYPALDNELPATLSRNILTGILRNRLGFEGVIISDDLEMQGLAKGYDMQHIVVKGVEAGLDIFLCCHTPEKQQTVLDILKATAGREHSAEGINRSISRILELKKRLIKRTD